MKFLYGSLLLLFVSNVSYSQSREDIGYVEYIYKNGQNQRVEKLWFTKDRMMLKMIEPSVRTWPNFANKKYTSLEDSLADEKMIHDLDERHKKDRQEIFRSINNVYLTRTNSFNGESFCYNDTIKSWKWELTSDTLTIAGFHCLKANTMFSSGEKAYVWYAPELAVPFGPQLFYGLPGLILEAGTYGGDSYRINTVKVEIPYKGKIDIQPCTNSKLVSKAEYMQHVQQDQERGRKMIEFNQKHQNSNH